MLVDPKSRVPSLVGLGIVLAGVPAFAFFRRASQKISRADSTG
jgi:hypothetical protein